MPKMYIEVPAPIHLKDPVTKTPVKNHEGEDEVLTFQMFINKLMSNPKWMENYHNMKSARAIEQALEEATGDVVELAEEDWKKLQDAAENPKYVQLSAFGPQTQAGYGYHPSLASQIIPMVEAVSEAKKERPVKLEAVEDKAG